MNNLSLPTEDINSILSDFPKFELSYEKMAYKKVFNSDYILAIPDGNKFFAWFTVYKEDNVCFILEIGDDNKIKDIKITLTSFDDKLVLGTILFGTIFYNNKVQCFCIEDLYFYKGRPCINKIYTEKLDILKTILTYEISQLALVNKYLIFGLPLISRDFNFLIKEIETLPYKVSQIKFRFSNARKILFVKYFKPNSTFNNDNNKNDGNLNNYIFKISPDIEPDIYNLFIYKNGKEEFYDFAFIPDYKTSVMMNKLFRKIKENDNLDAIEESDDELEFEDERDDKYVFLDRSYKMNCIYNSKFKRWVPINLANNNDRIVTFNQISNFTMK